MEIRNLPLVDASAPETATFAEGVKILFASKLPAIAVLAPDQRVVGILALGDVLRAVFPKYLVDLRHTSFLPDDPKTLDERARSVRDEPLRGFAREIEPLDTDESQTHAAERFMHTGEDALPVIEGERFVGMLTISALCFSRLGSADDASPRGDDE